MKKMTIFSPTNGKIIFNGLPVSGALIERQFKWSWKNENSTDYATSNEQGEFSFPLIERSSFLDSILPNEVVINQEILIKHDGKEYKA
jgi:hypothetical protein